MSSIEIFKTNVVKKREAKQLLAEMSSRFPEYLVNFDLEDCDKVLRVQANGDIRISSIVSMLKRRNIKCEVLN